MSDDRADGPPDPDDPDDGFDDDGDGPFDSAFDGPDGFDDVLPLGEHDIAHVRRDLADLHEFEAVFRQEGYRGVAVWCHDCVEEHYYPWDMLRENLEVLIETGETPVHEPAFAPEPEHYVPWDYARGYLDALADAGFGQRLDVGACPRCRLALGDAAAQANFCPRCATPLVAQRLRQALQHYGLDGGNIDDILRAAGLPG